MHSPHSSQRYSRIYLTCKSYEKLELMNTPISLNVISLSTLCSICAQTRGMTQIFTFTFLLKQIINRSFIILSVLNPCVISSAYPRNQLRQLVVCHRAHFRNRKPNSVISIYILDKSDMGAVDIRSFITTL